MGPTAKRRKVAGDLKVVVDDGELEVHSFIIASSSAVFEAMLESGMREGSAKEIQLPGKKLE